MSLVCYYFAPPNTIPSHGTFFLFSITGYFDRERNNPCCDEYAQERRGIVLMQRMQRNVTIRDVAKVAGVSKSTVSLVLQDSPKVAPKTRERVWQALRE